MQSRIHQYTHEKRAYSWRMQSKPTAGNQNERAYSWRMQSAPRLVIERIHIHLQKSELPCWGRKSPAALENKQHKTAGGERVPVWSTGTEAAENKAQRRPKPRPTNVRPRTALRSWTRRGCPIVPNDKDEALAATMGRAGIAV